MPQKPTEWPCLRNSSSGHASEIQPVAIQKLTQWPCLRNPPSGHASETHPAAMPLKTIQWSIQQSNIFQWPYFVHCLSSKHSAAKYLNMVFFILVKNCFYQMFGLVKPVWRMMTAPHFWDNVSPKFWFYKKHKSNCYILKIKWKWNVLYTGMKSCSAILFKLCW